MDVVLRPVTNLVGGLSDDERRQVFDLNLRCFGPPAQRSPHPLTIAPDEDTRYIVGVWEAGLLVSGLWITEREIFVDGQPTQMAGIRGVRTDPAFRRRGYAELARVPPPYAGETPAVAYPTIIAVR
jgi:hypothetical protein